MAVAVRALVRDACAGLLRAAGLTSYRRRQAAELLILTFHRVLPESLRALYPLPGLAVTPAELRWILVSLLPHFECGTVSELYRRQQAGAGSRPKLAISFDDGQWDNLEFAAPVLNELGAQATFYLPTDFMDGAELLWHDRAAFAWVNAAPTPGERTALIAGLGLPDGDAGATVAAFLEALKRLPAAHRLRLVADLEARRGVPAPDWARVMRWSEALALHAAGHEIGSHACSHDLLPQLDAQGQRREMLESRRAIEASIGVCPSSLCYPNGSFDARSVMLAGETGYENAVTTRWGINAPGQPRMELLRCDMDARRLVDRSGRLSGARMAMRLSGLQPGMHG